MTTQIVAGILFALVTAAVSRRAGFLTSGGAAVQAVLGSVIFGLGGWGWAIPILFFFFLSSLLSTIGAGRRREMEALFEKGATRDAAQVIANGGVGGLCAVVWALTGDPRWFTAYLGSVAAATADTWGTEVGVLAGGRPLLLTTLRPVERGTSGAVSPLGTFFGGVGALCIGLCGLPWSSSRDILLPVLLAGVVGSLADSLLGATLQAGYKCPSCGKMTERRVHCGSRTSKAGGLSWVGNDLVNFACTAIGAAIGLFMA